MSLRTLAYIYMRMPIHNPPVAHPDKKILNIVPSGTKPAVCDRDSKSGVACALAQFDIIVGGAAVDARVSEVRHHL